MRSLPRSRTRSAQWIRHPRTGHRVRPRISESRKEPAMSYGKIITLQPSDRTDHITDDGVELTQRPYPFAVFDNGDIINADAVGAKRAVGFSNDLAVQHVDLWWREVVKEPELAVGKYLVTQDENGHYATQT